MVSELLQDIHWRAILDFLDIRELFAVALVSSSWSSLASIEYLSKRSMGLFLGNEFPQLLSSCCRSSQTLQEFGLPLASPTRYLPRRDWKKCIDYILGSLRSRIGNGSNTTSSLAIAIISKFKTIIDAGETLPFGVSHETVLLLCEDFSLLSCTALSIAIKIEVTNAWFLFFVIRHLTILNLQLNHRMAFVVLIAMSFQLSSYLLIVLPWLWTI